MEKICLDYEAALDFLRGEPGTVEKLRYYSDTEEVCISAFTMVQLMETIKKAEIVGLLVNSVNVLPFDRKAAAIASRLIRELKDKGEMQRSMEGVFTAAICMANNAFLFTKSPKNYDGIKELRKV